MGRRDRRPTEPTIPAARERAPAPLAIGDDGSGVLTFEAPRPTASTGSISPKACYLFDSPDSAVTYFAP